MPALLAPLALVLALTSGCTSTTGWLDRDGDERSATRDVDGADISGYLRTMRDLAAGDPATKAEVFARVDDAVLQAPTTTNRLRLALALPRPFVCVDRPLVRYYMSGDGVTADHDGWLREYELAMDRGYEHHAAEPYRPRREQTQKKMRAALIARRFAVARRRAGYGEGRAQQGLRGLAHERMGSVVFVGLGQAHYDTYPWTWSLVNPFTGQATTPSCSIWTERCWTSNSTIISGRS